MLTQIGVKPKDLNEITQRLSRVLADEFVLYVKTLNAHWNVAGSDFHSKHIFFEQQYRELADIIDALAERIRTLGHYVPATLASFIELSNFTEQHEADNDSQTLMQALLEGHEVIINSLRKYINEMDGDLKDVGTADFATGLLKAHEKMAWMLRVHLM